MIPNHSPWIKQLKRTREIVPLTSDISTDVVIVGGGIAGITTAYFTLRETQKNVVLLEADKIAHGATGHNAGQITSYFERSFSSIVDEFGLEMATEGQRAVESAWMLLDEIVTDAKLQTPVYRFTGYAGLARIEDVLEHLENNRLRVEGGLPNETMVISETWSELSEIPKKYESLYTTAPHKDLLQLLETQNADYIATLSYQKGCLNSALFSEEVLGYLIATYPDRFSFFEGTPVSTVTLGKGSATISANTHTMKCSEVVLCTNGFENFTIVNEAGDDINTEFHHLINGRVGYMAGYIEPLRAPPAAISYFLKNAEPSNDPAGESYFYLTRRPHEHEGKSSYNLLCAGGPDSVLPNDVVYSRTRETSEEKRELIDEFLRATYAKHPGDKAEYAFCWHGLMGYTPNRIRRVGVEPCNTALYYNLGCNGVGILPSIYGGKRIGELLSGKQLPRSIFDPEDHRTQKIVNPFTRV